MNGKGDKDRTKNHKSFREQYGNIRWDNPRQTKRHTDRRNQLKEKWEDESMNKNKIKHDNKPKPNKPSKEVKDCFAWFYEEIKGGKYDKSN